MAHWEKATFIKDLGDFMTLIQRYDLPVDFSSVYSFQGKVEYSSGFSIAISNMIFHINSKMSGTIPSDVSSVSIFFDHECEFDQNKNSTTHDLIKSNYLFKIKLVGRDQHDEEFVSWWRLDQDIEGEDGHKTSHPYYHFQCGGDELEDIDTGHNLFLGAPRLAHPPMDLFLGFHFIINNFYNKKQYSFVNNLLNDEQYQEIILRAQRRLWEPYFNSFNGTNQHTDFNMGKVFPLFLKLN